MAKNEPTNLQQTDFSKWYLQTIQQADLFSYGPVRGTMIFKPDGYELWEHIQEEFNRRLKEEGIRNAYFPMLIPESYLNKEKAHVEGFAPELPWVTEVAGEKLEERLALRPTSETVIGTAMSEWVNSYRDLPMELNQWANVFRWEKRTLPFLRTTEFLWQEGHTAHTNEEEARNRTMRMLEIYQELCEELLAMPVYAGQKTPSERFAGAADTFSIEAMMKDTKAVQAGTSHYMGQNFSKAFDIKYLNDSNEHVYAYTTSWGASTRLIGAMIMAHGDEQGLVLPPRMASTQVVLIPAGNMKKNPEVLERLKEMKTELAKAGLRVRLDDSNNSAGYKFNEWELRGVPLRIEFGPRDMENNHVMVKMRDLDEKEKVSLEGNLIEEVKNRLDIMQGRLLETAKAFRSDNEHYDIDTLEDLKGHIAKCEETGERPGWILAGWDGTEESEAKIKEETGFTTRNIPFNSPMEKTVDLYSGKKAVKTVWFARAY